MILDVMILSTFEHSYTIRQWYLIDFSEMNENGHILFERLYLGNMEMAFAVDHAAVKQSDAGPNTPLCILSKFVYVETKVPFIFFH